MLFALFHFYATWPSILITSLPLANLNTLGMDKRIWNICMRFANFSHLYFSSTLTHTLSPKMENQPKMKPRKGETKQNKRNV